ncbi:MAG: phosphoribosylanthranilate isomerase [Planctomycetes bacterium]|nr:phosphoribosylanthranilate isomerase [Planctomycetota bacterium]
MVKVKICGITNYRDAADAIDCGADVLGFILARSPRQVTPDEAQRIIRKLPASVIKVGVFVDAPIEKVRSAMKYCGFNLVQLHGREDREYCRRLYPYVLKVFRDKTPGVIRSIRSYGAGIFMLDSGQGGTGKLVDLKIARGAAKLGNMILAGGLTPDNVAGVIKSIKPYGVDVSSGVEKKPGKKDKKKVAAFIDVVKLL